MLVEYYRMRCLCTGEFAVSSWKKSIFFLLFCLLWTSHFFTFLCINFPRLNRVIHSRLCRLLWSYGYRWVSRTPSCIFCLIFPKISLGLSGETPPFHRGPHFTKITHSTKKRPFSILAARWTSYWQCEFIPKPNRRRNRDCSKWRSSVSGYFTLFSTRSHALSFSLQQKHPTQKLPPLYLIFLLSPPPSALFPQLRDFFAFESWTFASSRVQRYTYAICGCSLWYECDICRYASRPLAVG